MAFSTVTCKNQSNSYAEKNVERKNEYILQKILFHEILKIMNNYFLSSNIYKFVIWQNSSM